MESSLLRIQLAKNMTIWASERTLFVTDIKPTKIHVNKNGQKERKIYIGHHLRSLLNQINFDNW